MHVIVSKLICSFLIFNQNKFPSHLQQHLFSDDAFTGVRAGQPVTLIWSTNSNPQPSKDSINSQWTQSST